MLEPLRFVVMPRDGRSGPVDCARTASNLSLIRVSPAARGEPIDSAGEIEQELQGRA